ncbi:GvpL/GvpF family gas vesicle protein [Streptomyces sp. CC210A]|uniref:GvpL/GvpF family gas vesicle protein n=1 Tax=Streptomyces sp. CC210A TaxID=2898184 RepID=UPI001F418EA0|nr:GvpL/GvpF family gas vesicle protein [Streptomyces sp. CC210A]
MTTASEASLRYVYAVCRPFDGLLPEGAHGITGEPPRLVRHDGLAAVVDAVPAEEFDEGPLRELLGDLDRLAALARSHEAVMAALTTVTSPLPLRLATVCRDDSGVRRLLERGHDRFVRTLGRLEGRVEWGVKAYVPQDPPTGSAPGARPSPRTAAPVGGGPGPASARGEAERAEGGGRAFLRQRLRERRGREEALGRAEEASRRLHDAFSAYAEESAVHPPQDPRLSGVTGEANVLNAAYLVPREQCEGFLALVDRARAEHGGVRLETTGPWAPYSFAGTTEDTA